MLLPHSYAFFDPMFSTGIAWSLLAVERLGLAFEEGRDQVDAQKTSLHRLELVDYQARLIRKRLGMHSKGRLTKDRSEPWRCVQRIIRSRCH